MAQQDEVQLPDKEPDYAGKKGGRSGAPGGHARERLEELLSERMPAADELEHRETREAFTEESDEDDRPEEGACDAG